MLAKKVTSQGQIDVALSNTRQNPALRSWDAHSTVQIEEGNNHEGSLDGLIAKLTKPSWPAESRQRVFLLAWQQGCSGASATRSLQGKT
jgi:hypothetical protein